MAGYYKGGHTFQPKFYIFHTNVKPENTDGFAFSWIHYECTHLQFSTVVCLCWQWPHPLSIVPSHSREISTKQITSVYYLVWKSVVSLTLKTAVFLKPNTSWKALWCANSLCEKANTSLSTPAQLQCRRTSEDIKPS